MSRFQLRKNHAGAQKIFPSESSEPEWAWREDDRSHYPYLLGEVEAPSWLEAKKAFALPLSEIQAKLAAGTITHFELFGRHWSAREYEDLIQAINTRKERLEAQDPDIHPKQEQSL